MANKLLIRRLLSEALSGMMVEPEPNYSKFNLNNDGIDPMSVTNDGKTIDSIANGNRRVGWIIKPKDVPLDELINKLKSIGVEAMSVYNDMNHPVAKEKIADISGPNIATTREWAENWVKGELIIYNPKYKKQAEAAHNELMRRGGFWKETEPEADIYMGRLMGYGEEYIVPYIRKYFPDFDVESYITKNPRSKTLTP